MSLNGLSRLEIGKEFASPSYRESFQPTQQSRHDYSGWTSCDTGRRLSRSGGVEAVADQLLQMTMSVADEAFADNEHTTHCLVKFITFHSQ